MKKILGISLVALFAAVPMLANAATGDPVVGAPVAQGTQTAATVTTTVKPKFAVATEATTDGNAASAGYVKGAYNASIRAINTVYEELDSKIDGKQAALSAGSGIAITDNKVSAVLTDKGGLTFGGSGDSATIGVLVDGTTIEKNSTSGALQVKANTYDAYGAAASAIAGLDSTVSQAAATDKPAITVKEIDGKLTEVTASIASGTISSAALASGAVTSAALASSAVTSAALASSAVTSAAIASSAVTSAAIASSAVTLAKIDSAAMINATDSAYTSETKLTTQGYVDEAVDGINGSLTSNYATKTGVVATVNAAKITVMNQWGSDTSSSTASVSVASYLAE